MLEILHIVEKHFFYEKKKKRWNCQTRFYTVPSLQSKLNIFFLGGYEAISAGVKVIAKSSCAIVSTRGACPCSSRFSASWLTQCISCQKIYGLISARWPAGLQVSHRVEKISLAFNAINRMFASIDTLIRRCNRKRLENSLLCRAIIYYSISISIWSNYNSNSIRQPKLVSFFFP